MHRGRAVVDQLAGRVSDVAVRWDRFGGRGRSGGHGRADTVPGFTQVVVSHRSRAVSLFDLRDGGVADLVLDRCEHAE